jgi:hypothetical protein
MLQGISWNWKKCACYLTIWDFQEDGYAFTLSPSKTNKQIIVYDVNGNPKEIKQLSAKT